MQSSIVYASRSQCDQRKVGQPYALPASQPRDLPGQACQTHVPGQAPKNQHPFPGGRLGWFLRPQGRTGRTCDGVVYRLLPRRVFLEHLPQFEAPHLTLLHLRRACTPRH